LGTLARRASEQRLGENCVPIAHLASSISKRDPGRLTGRTTSATRITSFSLV
jgi:hypothetical protein